MNTDEKRKTLENLLQTLPDVVSPMQVSRTLHQSKNLIYELLKTDELPLYTYSGRYLIAKLDLIEYMLAHGNDNGRHFKVVILIRKIEYITLDKTKKCIKCKVYYQF